MSIHSDYSIRHWISRLIIHYRPSLTCVAAANAAGFTYWFPVRDSTGLASGFTVVSSDIRRALHPLEVSAAGISCVRTLVSSSPLTMNSFSTHQSSSPLSFRGRHALFIMHTPSYPPHPASSAGFFVLQHRSPLLRVFACMGHLSHFFCTRVPCA